MHNRVHNCRVLLIVTTVRGGAPLSPGDLGGAPGGGQFRKPVVDPAVAHARLAHEVGNRNPFVRREAQGGPQHCFRAGSGTAVIGLVVLLRGVLPGRVGRFCTPLLADRLP